MLTTAGTAWAQTAETTTDATTNEMGTLAAAATAQAKADDARARAIEFKANGGIAYTTGAYDRAMADAARYQKEANAEWLAASPQPATYVSPELADAKVRLADLRQSGGWAYKTGAVSRAETDVVVLTRQEYGVPTVDTAAPTTPPPSTWTKPVQKSLDTDTHNQ